MAANSPLVPSFSIEYPKEESEKLRMTARGNWTGPGSLEARLLGAAALIGTDALLFICSTAVLLRRTNGASKPERRSRYVSPS